MFQRFLSARPGSVTPQTGFSPKTKLQENLQKKLIGLTQLKELASYPIMVLGNDPEVKGLQEHKVKNGLVMFVAVSGMRSLLLASELTEGNPEIPQIVLIDNSEEVHKYWAYIKEFAKKQITEESFLKELPGFIAKNRTLTFNTKKEDEIIQAFFVNLFKKFGFDRIHKMLINTINIKQSLENTETFKQLKAICAEHKIEHRYVYASNVVACVHKLASPESAHQILANIVLLNPTLSIHTDFDGGAPKNVLLCKEQNPFAIKTALKLGIEAVNSPTWSAKSPEESVDRPSCALTVAAT